MEVCIPCNTSAGQDISSNKGSSTDPLYQPHYNSRDLSIDDLEICLTQYLNIESIEISTSRHYLSPEKNDIVNVVKEDGQKDLNESKSSILASAKCLSKCSTFPPHGVPKSDFDGLLGVEEKQEDDKIAEVPEVNGCAKSVNQGHSRSVSLPTPMKLVKSAMKGSREKQGISPKNRSVTWAPDVYDPVPTSVSHFPSSKNQRHRSDGKKHGKNKQKGSSKSSRSKSKEKRQPRQNNVNTYKLKPLYDDSGVFGFTKPRACILDFNVSSPTSPDPFCGSSFLKNSVTKLHYPLAEAT
ncbi:hypothetical protein ACJIZ3_022009 [Penstemon smallii]|uniref:Uncharacterized protein n=1 Tax=Penstemon smallii TaxID=265156 RepID=A0ABD3SN14_9LAMI